MATGVTLRETEILDFLAQAGWSDAARVPLTADASTRRYERLRRKGGGAMLMDAPRLESAPCPPDADEEERLKLGWNAISRLAASRVEAFAAVSAYLNGLGLSAPAVLALDMDKGLAVVEDLGDALFARVIEEGGDEVELYGAAGEVLSAIHSATPPRALPYRGGEWPLLAYDDLALSANLDLFVEWMPKRDLDFRLSDVVFMRWERVRENLVAQTHAFPRSLILRDTHAENLLWMPQREGVKSVGLLDFQDAVLGWGEWDMSMLIHDARRDVSPAARSAAIRAWLNGSGVSRTDFDERIAVLGGINILRIMGIFARLVVRDSKPRYDQFQPRLRRLLAGTMEHPAMSEAKDFITAVAPHLLATA